MTDEARIALAVGLFSTPFLLLAILKSLDRFGPWEWPGRFVRAERGSRRHTTMKWSSVAPVIVAMPVLPPAVLKDPDVLFWSGLAFSVALVAGVLALDHYSRRIEGRFFGKGKNAPKS
ncbi:hypothetical protein NOF55_06650 [Rhizobiaceae bacterium BDR2-2]|uniref:Uncharacterized protein n=1 Tax=Ectorhizobium quercum TaxID=2965071 RepID=A0AAE3MYS0_9HYPH|nr:hypothetical protein [Ectorhizobium quercum]MCX8996781.1 hypothetical protein [Ectorhizobium quercum]